MKVLLIADRLSYNGRSTYALTLARGLKEAGIELQFCLTGGELRGRLDEFGIENFVIKYNFFSRRKLISFLREFRPDILHVTSEQALPPGRMIARRLGYPYLVTVHDLLEAENVQLHLASVLGVVVANEGLREVLVNRLNVPKSRIKLVAKGVDLATFDLPPAEYGSRLPVIGCIGRMVPGKGQEQFLRAARIVLDAGHEALFVLIGQGPGERSLRRLARELDLTAAVTLSPPIEPTRKIYCAIDILVLPATKAASSTTALEAMAARRPVVASVVGDLLHLIKNEENGLAVEPGNVEGLARAMIRLIRDPAIGRELGERARDFVSRKYPQSRMIEGTMALYEEIAKGEFPGT
jgi:glycosyltransferase involved in cell wall biosynthesis